MRNRIFKYTLQVEQRQLLTLPADAKLLSVGVQNQQPVLWALVDADQQATETLVIRGVTTGEEFNAAGCRFLGTVQIDWFVFHVFHQPAEGSEPDARSDRFQDDYSSIAVPSWLKEKMPA